MSNCTLITLIKSIAFASRFIWVNDGALHKAVTREYLFSPPYYAGLGLPWGRKNSQLKGLFGWFCSLSRLTFGKQSMASKIKATLVAKSGTQMNL